MLSEIITLYSNLFTALMIGLFTIVGIFLGAFLNRSFQNKHWMRQKRLEQYSDFWDTLKACNAEADKIDRKTAFYGQLSIQVYNPLRIKSKSIRLLLPKNQRETFERLLNDVTSNYGFAATHKDSEQFQAVIFKYIDSIDKLDKFLEKYF